MEITKPLGKDYEQKTESIYKQLDMMINHYEKYMVPNPDRSLHVTKQQYNAIVQDRGMRGIRGSCEHYRGYKVKVIGE